MRVLYEGIKYTANILSLFKTDKRVVRAVAETKMIIPPHELTILYVRQLVLVRKKKIPLSHSGLKSKKAC